jgi:Swiss Army Knife RNA repair-like protein
VREYANTQVDAPRNTRPILFVDVDGVISLFGFDLDRHPEGSLHWINGVLHHISPLAGKLLLRLDDHFELVWATGWEETANEYLPHLLGLPSELPCLSFDTYPSFGTAHWKIAAIEGYAGSERPVAWIDDSLDESCHGWAEERVGPTMLIETRSEEGMRDEHADALIEWAGSLSNGKPD